MTNAPLSIDEALQTAVENHQSGNIEKAEEIYRQILQAQPDHSYALHYLGVLYSQRKNYDRAIELIEKALRINPSYDRAYYDLGFAMQGKGQLDNAILYYQKAILADPGCDDAYYNLGVIFTEKKDFEKAVSSYQKALQLNPTSFDAWNNLGMVLHKKGILDEAIIAFQKALELNPDYALAINNLGMTLRDNGSLDEAETCFQKAIELNSNADNSYLNLGLVFAEKEQFEEAVTCIRKSIELNPDSGDAYYNLGTVLRERGKLAESIDCYEKALALNPSDPDVYINLGLVFHEKGDLARSTANFRKSIELNPEDPEAHWNLSHALLLSGNFKEGWKEYEWRRKLKDHHQYEFTQPLWDGSDIHGRILFVYAEQGFGDTIQFVRYISLLRERGAKVIVECQRELKSLIGRVEGAGSVIAKGEGLMEFDVHCPLLSLPMVFGTELDSIPTNVPYISADPTISKKWRERIKPWACRRKIGLVWSGNPSYKNDRVRSSDLRTLSALGKIEGITYFSLQKGQAAEQAKTPPSGMDIVDLTSDINDFEDTAGLVENLDLVISVDTSVAHLAGALGKSVWTLIPFAPDWRWMLEREDSPWYPTMRLFRQHSSGDWESVLRKLKDAL